jgi:hypothetical protein
MKRTLLLAAILTYPMEATSEDLFFFLLSRETALCLQENADIYTPVAGEITFIDAENCGEPSASSSDMSERVQNSAPEIVLSIEDGPDQVLAMASEDFACLVTLDIPSEASFLEFFPEQCDLKVRD